jgi:hypothetical protein
MGSNRRTIEMLLLVVFGLLAIVLSTLAILDATGWVDVI